MGRCKELDWETLTVEIWVEIMLKLPFKSLLASQLVCKTWNSIITCYQLFDLRMRSSSVLLPMSGLIVKPHVPGRDWAYFPVGGLRRGIAGNVDDYQGFKPNEMKMLTIELQELSAANSHTLYTCCHKGLILWEVLTEHPCYYVYNPATKQKKTISVYPLSCEMIILGGQANNHHYRPSTYPPACIINLTKETNDQQNLCRFMVVRFLKESEIVEIYYSHVRKWVRSTFIIHGTQHIKNEAWLMDETAVFHDGTLYFQTLGFDRVVAVKLFEFTSDFKPGEQILEIYSFDKPPTNCRPKYRLERSGVLGEVADVGIFYASYENDPWILNVWKYNHNQKGQWIQLARVNKNSMTNLRIGLSGNTEFNFKYLLPLAFHPNYPIIFLCDRHAILAYNFVTNTLERGSKSDLNFDLDYISTFSPCLAPFE